MIFKVKKESAGWRLDKFLTANSEANRSQIQKTIESGLVLVNGQKPTSKHLSLKEGDKVQVKDKKPEIKTKKDKEIFKKIKIVGETDDYLVVNKPAGLIVHGAPHIKEQTLADWLLERYPEIKKVGEDEARPGIVHRLDKDASGLMVVAKNNKMFRCLKKQFQNRLVEKEYSALVHGQTPKDSDVIDFSLKRSTDGFRQAAVPANFSGENLRSAATEYQVEKRFQSYTLLSVKIKSGRKHQIRVHFSAYGHPLAGDNLYGTRRTRVADKEFGLERVFLVARRLSFLDLSGQRRSFAINCPPELKKILLKIK